jgi:hypothetical protein
VKTIGLLLSFLACTPVWPADSPPSPAAQKFLGLFEEFRQAEARSASRRRVSFNLSDQEVNEYMQYALRITPRPGMNSVSVKFFPKNYVSTFTVVDFDAIERWKPGTVPSLLRPMLRGKRSVWVDFRFVVANSKVTFSVEKAYYDQVRLPAFFVQEMIRIIAARQPEHYDTSKPLALPFGLQQVWTEDRAIKGNN